MERRSEHQDRTAVVIGQFLNDRRMLAKLVTPQGDYAVRQKAEKAMTAMQSYDATLATQRLITITAKSEDVDKRDGALELLKSINLSKVEPRTIKAAYVDALRHQDREADPLGTVDSLLEAGRIIAPFFPKVDGVREQIQEAHSSLRNKMEHNPDFRAVAHKIKVVEKRRGLNPTWETFTT